LVPKRQPGTQVESLLVLRLFQTLATFARNQAFGTQHELIEMDGYR
jgi:hypothetical protein